MIPYLRRKIILENLEKSEIVHIEELVRFLEDTSSSTIRRDLKNLADDGLIEILHGGAAKLLDKSSYDMPLSSKQQIHTHEKEVIGRKAAELVKDGEVIYIDSGSTTLQMIKYIKNMDIQIVTSNTLILNQIEDAKFVCHILGGEVEKSLGSVYGSVTDNLLYDMYFDRSFLGATGVSNISGVSTPDFREANKKRIVMEHSKNTYVLADSTKIGKNALCKSFELNKCVLITDNFVDGIIDIEKCIIA